MRRMTGGEREYRVLEEETQQVRGGMEDQRQCTLSHFIYPDLREPRSGRYETSEAGPGGVYTGARCQRVAGPRLMAVLSAIGRFGFGAKRVQQTMAHPRIFMMQTVALRRESTRRMRRVWRSWIAKAKHRRSRISGGERGSGAGMADLNGRM
ncbi:hypothetical protein K523DRAFT_83925 [Schizophyllum commune Tattone D]|nr:hypothetical protein K523DRAFT_83925 [Schizophyllum commune Tattone D]